MKSPVRFSSRFAWRIQNLGDSSFPRVADALPFGEWDFFATVITVAKLTDEFRRGKRLLSREQSAL